MTTLVKPDLVCIIYLPGSALVLLFWDGQFGPNYGAAKIVIRLDGAVMGLDKVLWLMSKCWAMNVFTIEQLASLLEPFLLLLR